MFTKIYIFQSMTFLSAVPSVTSIIVDGISICLTINLEGCDYPMVSCANRSLEFGCWPGYTVASLKAVAADPVSNTLLNYIVIL